MIRRQPRSTLSSSSAASDVYKRQVRSHAAVARRDLPRGPVRRMTPLTTSSQDAKTVAAYGPWTSSKNVASDRPVVSSRVRTVSYTHLRAHETPEHLVC